MFSDGVATVRQDPWQGVLSYGWSFGPPIGMKILQATFSTRVDIFYAPIWSCLSKKGTFSTATPVVDSYLLTALSLKILCDLT